MTTASDPAAVARDVLQSWDDSLDDDADLSVNDLVKLRRLIEKHLRAHGEAEYRRGLEDAAKIASESDAIGRMASDQIAHEILDRSQGRR